MAYQGCNVSQIRLAQNIENFGLSHGRSSLKSEAPMYILKISSHTEIQLTNYQTKKNYV